MIARGMKTPVTTGFGAGEGDPSLERIGQLIAKSRRKEASLTSLLVLGDAVADCDRKGGSMPRIGDAEKSLNVVPSDLIDSFSYEVWLFSATGSLNSWKGE